MADLGSIGVATLSSNYAGEQAGFSIEAASPGPQFESIQDFEPAALFPCTNASASSGEGPAAVQIWYG